MGNESKKERERERTAMNRRNPPILSGSRFRISTRLSKGQRIANRRDRHWSISTNSSSFTRSVGTARCILHCCEYLDETLHEKCLTNVRQDFETFEMIDAIDLIHCSFVQLDESHRFENKEILKNLLCQYLI